MPRRIDVALGEVLTAIAGVDAALAKRTKAEFQGDWFLQRGVERAIEIISEAIRHVPDDMLATEPQIEWRDVRAIGNIIRHEYHRVEPDVIWSVMTSDFPALKAAVERMLARFPPTGT